MDPILSFMKDFQEYIIGITCFAECCENNKEITIEEVKNIKIDEEYVYFIGENDILGIPINGTIIDLDFEKGKDNLITVFNKKFGYIKQRIFLLVNNYIKSLIDIN